MSALLARAAIAAAAALLVASVVTACGPQSAAERPAVHPIDLTEVAQPTDPPSDDPGVGADPVEPPGPAVAGDDDVTRRDDQQVPDVDDGADDDPDPRPSPPDDTDDTDDTDSSDD